MYDGDGKRVKATVNGTTTAYVGNYYEWSNNSWTKYYYAGTTRLAMRTSSTLYFLLGDHLGSTSIVATSTGVKYSESRYMPWGEDRYTSTTPPTAYLYTGQKLESGLGLYFYNARFYDPELARFTSADSIIPEATQGTQAWDRYAYANNNPVRYNDPTGHEICDEFGNCYEKGKIVRTFKSIETHPDEYFESLIRSPLHGNYQYGNYLGPCTTNVCDGLHPGIDSQNIWTSSPPVLVNYEGRPIYSVADGIVIIVSVSDWGNYVMVEHDIVGNKYYSIYAHLSTQKVSVGDVVNTDTVLGTMGNSLKPPCPLCDIHLHFEIRKSINVNLLNDDPFRYKTWWPKTLIEFHQKWIDLSKLMQ